MRFGTATWLVLGMFGSFGLVLGIMVTVFGDKPRAPVLPVKAEPAETAPVREVVGSLPAVTQPPHSDAPSAAPTSPSPAAEAPPSNPPSAPQALTDRGHAAESPPPGAKVQRNIRLEQEEMALLRKEMERRLKEETADREQKLARLARHCEDLEPGEAARILNDLDDEALRNVLGRIGRQRAVAIAAVLQRLNRPGALSLIR